MRFHQLQLKFACFFNSSAAKILPPAVIKPYAVFNRFAAICFPPRTEKYAVLSAAINGGKIYRYTSQRNSSSWAARNLIDQSTDNLVGNAWSSKGKSRFPQDISIRLSSWAVLKEIKFSTKGILKYMKPREISLYCSLGTKGRVNLLNASLDKNLDIQTFPLFFLGNERFRNVQIRIKSNHGNPSYTALTEIEIIGIPTSPPPPKIQLSSPYSGDSLEAGSSTLIRWTAQGENIAGVSLSYSSDGGNTFPDIITEKTGNNGSYEWKIPSVSGSRFRIKISALDSSGQIIATDQTPADFVISRIISSDSAGARIASFSSQVNDKSWAAKNIIDGILRRKIDGGAWSSSGTAGFPHRLQIELPKAAYPTQIRLYTKGIIKSRKPKLIRVDAFIPESGTIINLLETSLQSNRNIELFKLPGLQHPASRFIQIEIYSNNGDKSYTSLSEVQIFGCESGDE